MDSAGSGWWRKHGWTVALLFSALAIAVLVRTVFATSIIQQWGALYVYGGGSDSFYHSRVMAYIVQNHANLGRDTGLNYPFGAVNPREPLFDWMNAVFGILFAPFFGGSAVSAGAFFLDAQGPIWAGLGVFPVFLIGREVSSKRTGIVAAFIYPLLVANIDSSTFGYANYLAFYTFFILLTTYGYLRTVRAVGSHRWVTSYRDPKAILAGLRGFLRTERTAVKWAVFTGVSFGTLALAWQGYSFFVAALVIFLVFALIVERIRKIDSFGLYVSTWIVGLVGFPMAVPYYLPQGLFAGWFDLPLLVFFGALLVVLPFVVLRDTPWVISIPVLGLIGAAAVGLLDVVNHAFFVNIVTGQGYFVKTLVYSTVAEAQAPSIDQLILGYGVVTFFVAFVGLALFLFQSVRARFRRVQMLFLVFAVISIYLPISAAKFFFLGSAAFALLAAEAIVRAIDIGGYGTLRRTVASLADRRSQFGAFRRAFKARQVLVMALVAVVVMPNVWYAVDAGVPYNSKTQYNLQIYNTLPPPIRTDPSQSGQFYLGAAGTQLDTPDQYDEAGYDWLAGQDQNVPLPQRPAFVSWWDYGFQALSEGQHPTVADNFQNGIDPAGNFLLSQNESQAIAILATRLLTGEQTASGQPYLPAPLNAILARDGVNLTELHTLMVNTSQDVPLVIAHPERYLPVDASHLDPTNAMYDAMAWFLATTHTLGGMAQLYNDVQTFTGWSIRYAMVDSRLFPASGTSTGIYYAPADLTDRIIGPGGLPTSYFSVSVVGSDGNTYPLGQVPPGVLASNYNIHYYTPFYNSMIYHIFAGYNGTDVGQSGTIPGIDSSLGNDPIMPGWMLQHFQVVYEGGYYCPFPDPSAHPGCLRAMNLQTAQILAKKQNGTATGASGLYYGVQGGGSETILEYYPGQTMTGTVQLPGGTPVPNARLTVYDAWGIPHMSVRTAADGSYSVVLPPGNDTVNLTSGVLNQLNQAGGTNLLSLKLKVPSSIGFNPAAPTFVRPIVLQPSTVQGFVYWNAANNSSYIPVVDPIVSGATVTIWGSGPSHSVTTDASGAFVLSNLPPGTYNMSIRYQGANFSTPTLPQIFLGAGVTHNATTALSPARVTGKVFVPSGGFGAAGAQVTVTGPAGPVTSLITNSTGGYVISNLGPGNYSISASLGAQGLGSLPHSLTILRAGIHLVANFTLQPFTTIDLLVVDQGNPAVGLPVRFTPITSMVAPSPRGGPNGSGPPGGGSTGPGAATTPPAESNSTTFTTDANGFVRASLPYGNYTMYALGLQGSQLVAGFASTYLPRSGGEVEVPPLNVAPAIPLRGSVSGPAPSPTNPAKVFAFTAHGDEVYASVNQSSDFVLYLPAGTYSVLAVQNTGSTAAGSFAGWANVSLVYPTTISLPLGPAIQLHPRVGEFTFTNGPGFFPAAGAEVRVSLSNGWTVTALADASGNVSFAVPSIIPSGASYCLSASAFGFAPNSVCGLSSSALGTESEFPLSLNSVPVNLTVYGLPAGVRLTVNFTAVSSTAVSVNATGGPSFNLTLRPGAYRISGWAASPTKPGLLLPPAPVNTTIAVGAQLSTIVLRVLHQVSSTGRLLLPSGLVNSSVGVHLSSPVANFSVSGTAFEGKFLAAPGTYSAYVVGTVVSGSEANGTVTTTFANLTTVTINATGVVRPAVALFGQAARLTGNVSMAGGGALNSTLSFAMAGPQNLSIRFTSAVGLYSVVVPSNLTYAPVLNSTQLVNSGGITRYENLAVLPGTRCTATFPVAYCDIRLTATSVRTPFTGTLAYAGFPGTLAGAVQLIGPLPGLNATTISVANGSFSAPLEPGNYQLYASAGGPSGPIANLSIVTVGPTEGAPVTVHLQPTWSDTVTVIGPGTTPIGPVTLFVRGSSSAMITLGDVALNTPTAFALPVGVYSMRASATGAPYGVSANATAGAAVQLIAGNAATRLALAFQYTHRATITVLPPTAVTVAGGDTISFAFVARNTGNAPETLKFAGSPTTWNFTFRPVNASLGVVSANSSVSGTVLVRIPSGTLAAPPPLQLQAFLPDGSLAGTSPSWEIQVVPFVGLTVGPLHSSNVLAPLSGSVSFWTYNAGNLPETLTIGVLNGAELAAYGWSYAVLNGPKPVTGPTSLGTNVNQTFAVKLTATTPFAAAPPSISLLLTASNGTMSVSRSLELAVPQLTVSLNSTGVVVTGPNLGSPSPYPEWLVPLLAFLPAIALVVGLVTYRWYRTRKWVRR